MEMPSKKDRDPCKTKNPFTAQSGPDPFPHTPDVMFSRSLSHGDFPKNKFLKGNSKMLYSIC